MKALLRRGCSRPWLLVPGHGSDSSTGAGGGPWRPGWPASPQWTGVLAGVGIRRRNLLFEVALGGLGLNCQAARPAVQAVIFA